MFNFPYFNLTKIYNWNFVLEGHWLALFWNWIWSTAFNWTAGSWGIFTQSTGHPGILAFCVSLLALFVALILIALIWCIFVPMALTIWVLAWICWYVYWKLFFCLIGALVWNIVAWIVIAMLTFFCCLAILGSAIGIVFVAIPYFV